MNSMRLVADLAVRNKNKSLVLTGNILEDQLARKSIPDEIVNRYASS